MADIRLGRLYVPDERDKLHPMSARLDLAEPLPAGKVWHTGPVLDQNGTPQCVAYAGEAWLMASPLCTKTGPTPEQIYLAAQAIDGWPLPHDGTSVRAVEQVLQAEGRIAEYVWAESLDVLKRWVLTRGTVILGTNWYESMFTVRDGYVKVAGQVIGGHGYLCVGYSGARKAYRCLNSWSKFWGDNGRFWIHEEDVARLLAEQGEACAAIEKKP